MIDRTPYRYLVSLLLGAFVGVNFAFAALTYRNNQPALATVFITESVIATLCLLIHLAHIHTITALRRTVTSQTRAIANHQSLLTAHALAGHDLGGW